MPDELQVEIRTEQDLVTARMHGRDLATDLGFSKIDATLIATAISEIARNIIVHAGKGTITISSIEDADRCGLAIVAEDFGPGIPDVEEVVRHGQGVPGLGLPGARRLMDEFDIASRMGEGTTVTMKKWRRRDELERLYEKRQR